MLKKCPIQELNLYLFKKLGKEVHYIMELIMPNIINTNTLWQQTVIHIVLIKHLMKC